MKKEQSKNQKRSSLILLAVSILLFVASIICFWCAVQPYFSVKSEPSVKHAAEGDVSAKNVLWISSYGPTHSNLPDQQTGIDQVLYEHNIYYDIVYMYSREYGAEEAEQKFYREISFRMHHLPWRYDALIVTDDDALNFVLQYRSKFFENLPIVFMGINDYELADEAVRMDHVTGIRETDDIEETIQLAKTLMPHANKVVGIYDNTPTGIGIRKSFFDTWKKFPHLSFESINTSELTKGELAEKLEGLSEDTIVIYMMMSEDRSGNTYTVQSAARLLVEASPVPVFRNYTGGLEDGVIGGVMMNMKDSAKRAADMTVRILQGEEANEIPLVTDISSDAVINYDVLQRYGLNERLIPKYVTVRNRPGDGLRVYHRILIPVALLLLSLLGFMLRERLRYHESVENARELRETTLRLELSQKNLQYQVEHDYLTKLANRQTAVAYLNSILPLGSKYTIILMDVDNFKDINESFGHHTGDEILVKIADHLEEMAEQKKCYAARYGGDEFLLMFPGIHLHPKSPELLELFRILRTPVNIGIETIHLNSSLGAANSDRETSPEQLIIKANLALNEAKRGGKNTCVFFTSDMKQDMKSQNRLKGKVFEAINGNGLYMVYQPKVSTQDLSVTGYEALVRMKDSELSPGIFIPIAEQNGWIRKIGRMTTLMTVQQLAEWRDQGYELKPVSINFSSHQIYDTGYVDFLLDLLKQYQIPANLIEMEITESLYVDRTQTAMKLFASFQAAGIKLLMDDFGTGYSSLSYLGYIPVDVIKLDKSMVDTYLVPEKDTFLHDVIRLGHDLGKKIIIEGVEEAWQYERLREFGGDIIQGYYFSQPLSPVDAIQYQPKKN